MKHICVNHNGSDIRVKVEENENEIIISNDKNIGMLIITKDDLSQPTDLQTAVELIKEEWSAIEKCLGEYADSMNENAYDALVLRQNKLKQFLNERGGSMKSCVVRWNRTLSAIRYGTCSICDYWNVKMGEHKYCPNCGAKIKKEIDR